MWTRLVKPVNLSEAVGSAKGAASDGFGSGVKRRKESFEKVGSRREKLSSSTHTLLRTSRWVTQDQGTIKKEELYRDSPANANFKKWMIAMQRYLMKRSERSVEQR